MSRETSAREWFDSAERDRLAAKHLLDSGDYEACAFHCQQAVEKLLKAIIIKQGGKRPPYLHNLRGLLEMVSGIEIDKDVEEAVSSINSYILERVIQLTPLTPIYSRSR
ncbi:MAG: HEPN domain-containing protein [Chloroflexi bacterium]|nr:HEPN domain-containing protein [Chloroflexota bacterium]